MTHSELNEAYGLNLYGAILEVEQAVETLREGIEEDNPEAIEQAVTFFDDIVPPMKTAINARYSADTEWVPFNTTPADATSVWILEYDSNNAQRVRRRKVSHEDLPTAAELSD